MIKKPNPINSEIPMKGAARAKKSLINKPTSKPAGRVIITTSCWKQSQRLFRLNHQGQMTLYRPVEAWLHLRAVPVLQVSFYTPNTFGY